MFRLFFLSRLCLRAYLCTALLCAALLTAGCSPKPSPVVDNSTTSTTTTDGGDEGTAKEGDDEVLLEPFDPPPLEELESQVTWVDQRVIDPMQLLREQQLANPPSTSVEEALKLRNQSAEDNAKIIDAIGRLPASEDQVNYDATIVRHIGGDIKSTNPLMINSTSEFDLQGLIGLELFGFDWEMQALAKKGTIQSWQTSDDGLYDKVVIRDDLTWSDGEPVTAHDVAFSFQTIMNPKVPVPAVRAGTDKLKWVHAYDDHTIMYFHKDAAPTNIWNINFPVIPRHIYEESVKEDPTMQDSPYHVKMENQPVTGGPYKLVKRERGQEIVVQRRDEYFFRDGQQIRPLSHFKEVRFRVIEDPNTALLALKSGEIEETSLTAEQWVTQSNNDDFYQRNTRATAVEWVSFHFLWNCKAPFFSDKRARKAMSYAFDHDEMLDKLFYGLYEPATGPFHRTAWMAPKPSPQPYKQDLDKAESLLEEAGWTDSDGDGILDKTVGGQPIKFEFTIICSQTPNSIKVCTLLKENLDRIGIICHVQPLEFTVLQQKELDHQFHAAMGGWGTGTDPDTTINIFGTDENRNFGQYSNTEVDRLFEQGRKEFDREKRAAIYAKIHELLYEDQPYTWLFYRNSFYGFNKNLRGYKFSPRGPYNYNPGFSALWKVAP